MQFATRSLPVCLMAIALALPHADCSISPAWGEEPPKVDPYESVWESLSELIRKREYGTAASLIDSLIDDPKLRDYGSQIRADKEVIAGLQALEQVVFEQAAKLPEGTRLDAYGVECTFVRYDINPKGDELVLLSQVTGKEFRKPLSQMPSSTWLQLAEAKLDAVKHPSLVLGIFVGFDRSPDVKAARKLLNDAASEGADVTQWLARLEEMLQRKAEANAAKDKTEEADPILGRWRMTVKNDGPVFDLEFRDKGTVLGVLTARSAKSLRRTTNPRPGRWTRDGDGNYRVTLAGGITMELRKVGDRLIGRNAAGGEVLGLRHVAK